MKKRHIKSKLLVLSAIAVIVALSAYGSIAYFTVEDTARNVITAGNVKIELQETMLTPDGENIVPFEDQIGVMPGCEVSKIVRVKNTGEQPSWIRVSVEKAIELAEGVEGEVDLSLVSFDLNTKKWIERDSFFYYTEVLEPGQTTEPLFTSVAFSKTMSNLYQDGHAILTVCAYGVQTVHNGNAVLEAAGWPAAN